MSDDEIDKAVREAQQYEAQDKARKEAIDARNEADSKVFQVEKALKEVGDKVSASEKSGVEADLQALKDLLTKTPADAMTEAQVTDIKAAKDKLMNSSQALFTKMYENMQQGQAGGPNMGGAGPDMSGMGAGPQGGDDDVVDADYKEV